MLKEIGDHFSIDVGSVLFRMILRQYHEGRNEFQGKSLLAEKIEDLEEKIGKNKK